MVKIKKDTVKFTHKSGESKKGNQYSGIEVTFETENGDKYRCFGFTPRESQPGQACSMV